MYRWKNDRIWLWYCGIYFLEFIEYELLEELIEIYAIYLYFFLRFTRLSMRKLFVTMEKIRWNYLTTSSTTRNVARSRRYFANVRKKKRKQTFVSVAITCLSLNHVVIFERLTNHSHRLTHPTSRRGDAMTRSFSISPSYCVSKRRGRVRENAAISYARDVPG